MCSVARQKRVARKKVVAGGKKVRCRPGEVGVVTTPRLQSPARVLTDRVPSAPARNYLHRMAHPAGALGTPAGPATDRRSIAGRKRTARKNATRSGPLCGASHFWGKKLQPLWEICSRYFWKRGRLAWGGEAGRVWGSGHGGQARFARGRRPSSSGRGGGPAPRSGPPVDSVGRLRDGTRLVGGGEPSLPSRRSVSPDHLPSVADVRGEAHPSHVAGASPSHLNA